MRRLVLMVTAIAMIAACSSPDSVTSAESTTSIGTTFTLPADAPAICGDLQTLAEADARTRDPAAQTWEQQRDLILDGAQSTTDAYDGAVADAGTLGLDPSVTADLTTVRDFTAVTIDAVRSSVSFDDFSARLQAMDSEAATAATLRLDDYSTVNCGFPLSTGGA